MLRKGITAGFALGGIDRDGARRRPGSKAARRQLLRAGVGASRGTDGRWYCRCPGSRRRQLERGPVRGPRLPVGKARSPDSSWPDGTGARRSNVYF